MNCGGDTQGAMKKNKFHYREKYAQTEQSSNSDQLIKQALIQTRKRGSNSDQTLIPNITSNRFQLYYAP